MLKFYSYFVIPTEVEESLFNVIIQLFSSQKDLFAKRMLSQAQVSIPLRFSRNDICLLFFLCNRLVTGDSHEFINIVD